jgi:hypothetical protein
MVSTLEKYFKQLDESLSELVQSESTIEYAPHVREPFDKVVAAINDIRTYVGGNSRSSEYYFDNED